jgi:hypothetical protein
VAGPCRNITACTWSTSKPSRRPLEGIQGADLKDTGYRSARQHGYTAAHWKAQEIASCGACAANPA